MSRARPDAYPSVPLVAAALVGVLLVADIVAMATLADFWTHPSPLRTRFGVAANEVLTLAVLVLVTLSPALLVERLAGARAARVALLLLVLPALLLLIGGWSFFTRFDRFIGVYALQMLTQDTRQMVEFAGKMPSTFDPATTLLATIVPVLLLSVVLSRSRPATAFRGAGAGLAIALVITSIPASLAWNRSLSRNVTDDDYWNKRIDRIDATEFDILGAKSGPFAAFVDNVSNYVLNDIGLTSADIDTSTLRPRTAISAIEGGGGERLNIVYVLVESLRADMLAAFGADPSIMPTVNALAANGYVFTNVWAQASHSNYADVSALSGQYPLRSTNIHFYPKNPDYPRALPWDVLAPLGYHAGVFSSQNEHWGLMSNYLQSDSLERFSHVGSTDGIGTRRLSESNKGVTLRRSESGEVNIGFGGFMYRETGSTIERLDGRTTDEAVSWLDTLATEKPFFAYFNFQASHYPFNSLPEGWSRRFLTEESDLADQVRAGKTLDVPLEMVKRSYQDALNYVDSNLARLIERLKADGRHDSTVYVISADTAMMLGTDFLGNGGELSPEVLHVPVIISTPERRASGAEPVRVTSPGGQIDIMPTALTLAGAGPHPASQGIDLLGDVDDDRVVYAFAQTPASHQASAIWRGWQLVHDYDTSENTLRAVGSPNEPQPLPELDRAEIDGLARALERWIDTQLAYYANASVHERFYPPRFDGAGVVDVVTSASSEGH